MANEVRGGVARAKGAPVTAETVVVPRPGAQEFSGFDRFVTETVTSEEVEEAFAKMPRGEVLRLVAVF